MVIRPNYQGRKGRGAVSNPKSRLDRVDRIREHDGWWISEDEYIEKLQTQLAPDASKTIISFNKSPDIPFDRSINPYKGCEHGCVYCYARPTHGYLGLSPGLDFETKIFLKECLRFFVKRNFEFSTCGNNFKENFRITKFFV